MKRAILHAREFGSAFRRTICIFLAVILCFSLMPVAQAAGQVEEQDESQTGEQAEDQVDQFEDSAVDVNYSAVCKLTPEEATYNTGDTIRFKLLSYYATPGDASRPQKVTFAISIPNVTPAVRLHMFSLTGSGDYEGVPMYSLIYEGRTANLYLMTGSAGDQWIEFTLDAGSTLECPLSMEVLNGGSKPIPAFTLTPTIISEGDYSGNNLLQAGTTKIDAQFGWTDFEKTGSTDDVGVIDSMPHSVERIDYLITAESAANSQQTGCIYTDHYVLTDTLSLAGLHFDDGELTFTEKDGVSSFYLDGKPVLEIAALPSTLKVEKVMQDAAVSGFKITYAVDNATLKDPAVESRELSNLSLSASLLLSELKLNAGTEDTYIKNDAVFDAYSPFDEHVHFEDSHIAYTQDRYQLVKSVFTDAECTKPAEIITDGDTVYYKIAVTNSSASEGPFDLVDTLPYGLSFVDDDCDVTASQEGQTITWGGLTIPTGDSYTIVLETKFDSDAATDPEELRNVVRLCSAGRILAEHSVTNPFLTGETTSSDLTFEKSVNKSAAGINDPLTYTIKVNNSNATSPKLITVTDKWPGEGIIPTEVVGCEVFKLLDESGKEYSIDEVKPSTVIKQIKCYNVPVPAGGSTEIKITGVITQVLDQMVNSVDAGNGAAGGVEAKTYGVRIEKAANAYDTESNTVGEALTDRRPVSEGDTVCYTMTVTNLKESTVTIKSLTDKLPTSMELQSVSYQGVEGSVILERGKGKSYSALAVTGDSATNYQTTESFELAGGESVHIYLFAKLTDASMSSGSATSQRITNYAYVSFNGVQTGDASANIYTYRNNARTLFLNKYFKFVADFNDNLEYTGTWLQFPDGGDVPAGNNSSSTATVWKGAYVGYQVQIKNTSALNLGNVDIYKLVDTLPAGMEFVGVAYDGNTNTFNDLTTAEDRDLTGDLIPAGETGRWTSGNYSSEISVGYDKATREISISFGNGSLSVLPAGTASVPNAYKPFFLIVARVREDSEFTSFENKVEVTVDKDVSPYNSAIALRSDEEHNYLSASCIANTIEMQPGILKRFTGHFFPKASTVDTSASISPGESLRYEVQVKNQGISDSPNAANANYRDFTVTDVLPPQFVYSPNSATVELNAGYDAATGLATTPGSKVISKGNFEPTIEKLEGGGTKLTWTFSGVDMRLKSSSLSSGAGFMHVITYDTDWNNDFEHIYGNYTNTAYFNVNEKDKFSTISTGTLLKDSNTISAGTVVSIFGAVGTTAIETVTNYKDTTSSDTTEITIPVDGPGDDVLYTLQVSNNTANTVVSQVQSLVIINELSRAEGDTGVVNRVERGSEFSVYLDDDPNVTVTKVVNGTEETIPDSEYEIAYGNSNGGLNSNGDWSTSTTGGRINWSDDSDGKNALRVAFNPGYTFSTDDTVLVRFTAYAGDDADPGETARNSFGYTYRAVANNGQLSEKIYAEPESVGITVPGGALNVTKSVTGNPAPVGDMFSFVLYKNDAPDPGVKYHIDDGATEYTTTQGGMFQIKAGQTAKLAVEATGNYKVEEVNLPANYTYKEFPKQESVVNGTTVVTLTCINTYKTPEKRDITVDKVWVGKDDARPASVKVQLYEQKTADSAWEPFGSEVTLNADNSWRHTWTDCLTSSEWKVDEISTPTDYTKTITGNAVDGFIVTNTHKDAFITLSAQKVWAGAANPNQPSSVDVQLYCDNKPYGLAVTLNKDNSWACTWPNMDSGKTWELREVTELGTGYQTSIVRNGNNFVVTNTYTAPTPTTVNISVTKRWEGAYDPNQPTSVNIQLYRNGNLYDTKTASAATNWACQWPNMDAGYTWAVREGTALPVGYTSTVTGNVTDGFIITNTYNTQYGKLSLSKTVGGVLARRSTNWHFNVFFSDNGTYSYTGSHTGTLTSGGSITLRHGQSIVFDNIPVGTTYVIYEREANTDGYYTTSKNSSGTISNELTEAVFNNYKSSNPKTGDSSNLVLWSSVLAGSSAILLTVFLIYRKKRETR